MLDGDNQLFAGRIIENGLSDSVINLRLTTAECIGTSEDKILLPFLKTRIPEEKDKRVVRAIRDSIIALQILS